MFLKPTASVPSTVQADNTPCVGVPSAGAVSVLLDRVSEPAKVAKVPVVGSVTVVAAVTVNAVVKAPEIVNVLAALFDTPVPPFAGPTTPLREDALTTLEATLT